MRQPVALAVALFTALAMAPGAAAAAPPEHPGGQRPDAAAPQQRHDITLVTGDRVRVGLGQPPSVTVLHTPGRERVGFQSYQAQGRHYLVPLDAMPLVASGRLDRRLFDLSELVASGYTDDRRASLPLLLTSAATADAAATANATATAGAAATAAGLTVRAVLAGAGAVAAEVAKKDAAAVWRQLVTAPGIEAVWLDGLRQPTLEHSVPQIGAPAAHAAGFTGSGVRVAVLDTGVDDTHPDLAGRVTVARNFTEEPDGDVVGHGTHVASTVAGTGAASAGRYRGVAYDATLLSGKVCEVFGCMESAILAGMEWAAAEQHADVVNLSLGGPDTAATDPLEAGIDRLTAEHGTLFVVSAGNAGSPGSVGSPSTADAALSVGAVDRDDQLAAFSSRGPRHDGAVKPEVTAPGVEIVAAHAGGSGYIAQSGTSMAAPHVAGAVALLAQQHPDWTPAQLKALLVGTGRRTAGAGVFDQGGGRVDLAAAVGQSLLAGPATLSLGRQLWPHDDDHPVHAETTITNTGATDVTLTLDLEATGPAGMFTQDATEVTVPAGGSAVVGVTADTRVAGPDGVYGGWLTATGSTPGGEVTLAVPVAVDKEVESYDVRFDWRDLDGGSTPPAFVGIIDVEHFSFYDVDVSGGPVTVRLPAARYRVEAMFVDRDGSRFGHLLQPALQVTDASPVTLDATRARPVWIGVPDADLERAMVAVGNSVEVGDRGIGAVNVFPGSADVYLGHLGPALDGFHAYLATQWAVPDGTGWYDGSPELYATFTARAGGYFTGFDRTYQPRDFATVHAEHHTQVPGRLAGRGVAGLPTEGLGLATGLWLSHPLPSTRTEHLTGEGVLWSAVFEQFNPEVGAESSLETGMRTLRPGHRYTDRWNRPVFGPGLPDGGWIGRAGDLITALPPQRSDRDRHAGFAYAGTVRVTLFRNGEQIAVSDDGGIFAPVPPEPADYRLEVAVDNEAPFSGRVSAVWGFRSGHVEEGHYVTLPATAVSFAPPIDDAGVARGGRPALVPVGVERQGLPASDVRRMTVEVSYDDGVTWRRVPLLGPGSRAASAPETEVDAERLAGARWLALLNHPHGPGTVSLRASGADRYGNSFEQTIIGAYALR